MAEPLSVAASAIGIVAFAQQLTQSIFKIKRFCQDVANAPTELQAILEQIENVSNIMVRLGQEEARGPQSSVNEDILQESLRLSGKAVQRVSTLASELQDEVKHKRYRASVKMVLKRDTMEKMLARLDRSKTDLHFAYSIYADARKKQELECWRQSMEVRLNQVQMMQYTQSVLLNHTASEGECDSNEQLTHLPRRRQVAHTSKFKLSLPSWLCQYACDVAFTRASGYWTMSLKCSRTIDDYHPVWYMCKTGDLQGLRNMLESREVSLHDRGQRVMHSSLVSSAAEHGQAEVVRFLVGKGAEPVWWARYQISHWGAFEFRPIISDDTLNEVRTRAKFLHEELNTATIFSYEVCDPVRELEILAKNTFNLSHEEKLIVLCRCETRWPLNTFLDLFPTDNIEAQQFRVKGPDGMSLLHILAHMLSDQIYFHRTPCKSYWSAISKWIEQAIGIGIDLHRVDQYGRTPFVILLARSDGRAVEDVLGSWIQCLAYAGVDLQLYGDMECNHRWRRHDSLDERLYDPADADELLGFGYGPTPADWCLYWRQPGDIFSSIFWLMIERQETHVPGAWIEDVEAIDWWEEDAIQCERCRIGGVKRKKIRKLRRRCKTAERNYHETDIDAVSLDELRDTVARRAESAKVHAQ